MSLLPFSLLISSAGTDGATLTASRLLFSGLPSEVSSSHAVVVTKKLRIWLVPATALSSRRFFSRFLQRRRLTCVDVYPTDTSQWSWTRHILFTADTTDNSASINRPTLFPHYNGVFKNIRIKTPTATRIGRCVHSAPQSQRARASMLGPRHRRMQQPSKRKGSHNVYYTFLFRHCESFGSLALVCWQNSCSTQWLRELHVAAVSWRKK